jgi:hypothetical protein
LNPGYDPNDIDGHGDEKVLQMGFRLATVPRTPQPKGTHAL